jgi:hypothetical protein
MELSRVMENMSVWQKTKSLQHEIAVCRLSPRNARLKFSTVEPDFNA